MEDFSKLSTMDLSTSFTTENLRVDSSELRIMPLPFLFASHIKYSA
jgi:hypothetical protein